MSLRDQKIKTYLKEAQSIFPKIDVSVVFSIYNGEEPTSGNITLSNQSDAFKHKLNFSRHTNIIHYTSLDSLFSILNSQILRLYNCFNLNDPTEIDYANVKYKIALTQDELLMFKRNNFVASFCEYDMTLQNDDFNLWRLYGMEGNGVGLVFEIENMDESWEEFFIGKVSYNQYSTTNSIVEQFSKFVRFHREFNEQHHLFENTPSILSAIALLFKDEIWKTEKEIRLFAYCPYDEYDLKPLQFESKNNYLSNTMGHAINKNGEMVSFVNLPLNINTQPGVLKTTKLEDLSKDSLSSIPHLKLKRIVLGYNINENMFDKIEKILNWLKDERKMDFVELGYSLLRNKFNPKRLT